jgi:hypothetical protein
LPIRVFHYNNKRSAGQKAEEHLSAEGVVIYYSPPGNLEQNLFSERAGGMIIRRMRILIIEGKLPKELWPEVASAAVWLLNRTLTYLDIEKKWIVL